MMVLVDFISAHLIHIQLVLTPTQLFETCGEFTDEIMAGGKETKSVITALTGGR